MEELGSAYKLYCGAEADGCAIDTESLLSSVWSTTHFFQKLTNMNA